MSPQPPSGQKIARDKLYRCRPREVPQQCAFDGARSASRPAEQQLFIGRQYGSFGARFEEADETFVWRVRALPHRFEARLQLSCERTFDFRSKIAPAAFNPI